MCAEINGRLKLGCSVLEPPGSGEVVGPAPGDAVHGAVWAAGSMAGGHTNPLAGPLESSNKHIWIPGSREPGPPMRAGRPPRAAAFSCLLTTLLGTGRIGWLTFRSPS